MKVYCSESRSASGNTDPKTLRPCTRIKITTDKDCLPPDALRVVVREFPNYESILETAEMYHARGYEVCVDTEQGLVEYEQ